MEEVSMDKPQDLKEEISVQELHRKIDELLELAPIIKALGQVLIRSGEATKRAGLGRDTLSKNDRVPKFEEVGHSRTYIQVGDLRVVKKRKRRR